MKPFMFEQEVCPRFSFSHRSEDPQWAPGFLPLEAQVGRALGFQ